VLVSNILYVHPIFREDLQFEHIFHYFSDGLVQPPTSCNLRLKNAGWSRLEDDFPFQLGEV